MSDYEEFFPFEGPPKVNKPNRRSSTRAPRFHRAKSTTRVFDKPIDLEAEAIPGTHDYQCLRESARASFRNKPGFPNYRKTGTPCGMVREQAEEAWKIARERALEDLERILPSTPPENTIIERNAKVEDSFPTDNEITRSATLVLLELMHAPGSARDRGKFAKDLLDFYKSKPSIKTETTINTAESWLESLNVDPAVPAIPGAVAKGE